ncbi:MAG: hypothetical protein J7493_13030 [Porphyrobacter sp.]|nr:hypothetical protein [Porphyrobacter sp.]
MAALVRQAASLTNLNTGFILLVGLIALAVAFQVSLAGAVRSTRPQLALTVAPFDARARAKLGSQLVVSNESRPAAQLLAEDAIRRDLLMPEALRVLAQSLDTGSPKSQELARGLMLQSQRLSRRDVMTQMWLVNYYGRQGEPEQLVQHLDIVLRTSETSRAGVFPLLISAASDPRGEEAVVETISKRPNWSDSFAIFAASSGTDLEFSTRITRLLMDPAKAENKEFYNRLMQRLVNAGRYAAAWDVYSSPGLVAKSELSAPARGMAFEVPEGGGPFDWLLTQESELWASRERVQGRDGFVLKLAAYNGRSGEVARQYVHLKPGDHTVRVRMGDIPTDRFERPELRIECASTTEEALLARLVPDKAGSGPMDLSTKFSVPSGCNFQRLTVQIAGEGSLNDPLPWIDDLRFE